jgi:alpha-L-fucosidase
VDIVSKNGNLLLNIGPRSDGTIPDEVQHVLREVGAWLAVNGEAIYGTRTWTKFGEGPTKVAGGSFHDTDTAGYTAEDFRFTTKGSALYAIELAWPAGGEAVIRSLGTDVGEKVDSVSLLGSSEKISFEQRGDGLHLRVPASAPTGGKIAVAYRITFEGGKLPVVAAAAAGAAK